MNLDEIILLTTISIFVLFHVYIIIFLPLRDRIKNRLQKRHNDK